MALINLRNVGKTYEMGANRVAALHDVSLSIDEGEFVCITGPSGSGKSTMMHILGCLDRPTQGSYELDGQQVASMSPEELADTRNRRIGFVFQGFNLLPRTSALENVEVPLLYSRSLPNAAERKRRGLAVLDALGLKDRADHHPSQLSGGQQQRVAIARALVNEPSLILADEPTGNLDSATSVEVMNTLQALRADRGITVILITHEAEIAAYGTRVISIRDGVIREDRPNPDRRPAHDQAAAAVAEA
ncbi:MAG: ABC transporter ATP-binding protein [Pseudomonadota bacterium]